MADVNCVLEIEMRRQRGKIVGIVVHVVAVAGLGGSSMAAPVMGDDAIAVLEEEQHLGVPVIGRQGPAVAEYDGLTASPVLVEDLDAIGSGDHAHVVLPSYATDWHKRPTEFTATRSPPNCHAPCGRLPARQVVVAVGPHPPVELVTVAPRWRAVGPRRPCP